MLTVNGSDTGSLWVKRPEICHISRACIVNNVSDHIIILVAANSRMEDNHELS